MLPKELRDLNYDQHRDIRWKDEYTIVAPGIDFANRFHIWMGVMAYLGSPIWLMFLTAGAVDPLSNTGFRFCRRYREVTFRIPVVRFRSFSSRPRALLFLPKIFAMFLAIPKAQQFGACTHGGESVWTT